MPEETQNNNNEEGTVYDEIIDENDSESIEKRVKTLKEKLEQCRKEKEEYLAGWQRAKADFINYKNDEKKRVAEFTVWSFRANILMLLPAFDDLEKAISRIPDNLENNEWAKGIVQIKNKIGGILKDFGLEEIKTVGEKFNPEFHETVGELESDAEDDTIIEEVEKGYVIDKTVIRPAKVKISKNNKKLF